MMGSEWGENERKGVNDMKQRSLVEDLVQFFLFSKIFLELSHHCSQYILIFFSCGQLLHKTFICD